MKPFASFEAPAIVLPRANVDTDIITPARHLKTISRLGLGKIAFETLRYTRSGDDLKPFDNVIDKGVKAGAQTLVVGDNFGCGSSREHAVWAIADLGIKALFSTSFADIFRGNCKKNGVLAATVKADDHAILLEAAANAPVSVNLEEKIVKAGNHSFDFEVSDDVRAALLEGRDDIGDTLTQEAAIAAFEAKQRTSQPWLYEALKL